MKTQAFTILLLTLTSAMLFASKQLDLQTGKNVKPAANTHGEQFHTPSQVQISVTSFGEKIAEEDSLALLALYNSTDGDNWTNNTNWLTDQPVELWRGVKVENGYVLGINLQNNNLTGTLAAALGNLSKLRSLNLKDNKLSGSIPAELSKLTLLGELLLSSNDLTGTIPSDLSKLTQLLKLHLNENYLQGSIPADLGKLSKLIWLRLEENQLTGTIPSELGNLSQLEYLILSSNKLTGPLPDNIFGLGNLVVFAIGDNPIGGTIPGKLAKFTNLTSLSLYKNKFTGTIPKELGQLENLVGFNLAENDLNGPIPDELSDIPYLAMLNLANNNFSGPLPSWLGELLTLNYLALNGNQFNGSLPSELANITNLGYLLLDHNEFSGSIPAWLTGLGNLYELYLNDNQFTGMADLSAIGSLEKLDCSNNKLTFKDLEPSMGSAAELTYSPQDSVDTKVDGPGLFIDRIALMLSVADDGDYDYYQWYKNDVPISRAKKPFFYIPMQSDEANGTYYCKIANTKVTELELCSRKVYVENGGLGTIHVVAWHDANENGKVDDDECGLSGIEARVAFEDNVSKHLTDSSGKTKFQFLLGSYTLELNKDTLPEGAVCTTNSLVFDVDLDIITRTTTLYFGFSGTNVAAEADDLVNRPVNDNEIAADDALVVIDGSATFNNSKASRGWSNAVDGEETGWDGTTLAMPDTDSDDSAPWAIFKFADEKVYKFNYIKFRTDNGTDDDNAEKVCQAKKIQVLVSTTGTEKDDFTPIGTFAEKYSKHKMQWCKLANYATARYIKLRLLDPVVPGQWTEIVEFALDTLDKTGPVATSQDPNVTIIPENSPLLANYPNPFNPSTTIVYQVEKEAQVSVRIYDIVGKQVAELVNENQVVGQYEISWNAGDLSSGVYFVTMNTGVAKITKRMLLMK